MNQYCRYCSWCIYGDFSYCEKKNKTMSDKKIKSANKCKDFDFNPLDVLGSGEYKPRKKRKEIMRMEIREGTFNKALQIKNNSIWDKNIDKNYIDEYLNIDRLDLALDYCKFVKKYSLDCYKDQVRDCSWDEFYNFADVCKRFCFIKDLLDIQNCMYIHLNLSEGNANKKLEEGKDEMYKDALSILARINSLIDGLQWYENRIEQIEKERR